MPLDHRSFLRRRSCGVAASVLIGTRKEPPMSTTGNDDEAPGIGVELPESARRFHELYGSDLGRVEPVSDGQYSRRSTAPKYIAGKTTRCGQISPRILVSRLGAECKRLGSATHCLSEWTEPVDAHADLDEVLRRGDAASWDSDYYSH
jgi:hypothetical protein